MTRRGSSSSVDPKWDCLIRQIPGYDPIATAGDAWFDADAAQLAIDFFPACLRHVEGAVADTPFILERWQQAIIANLFGWKRRDPKGRVVRRYRKALIFVPRKNGKTPLVAGIALYVFFCDQEKGQQDYVAAASKEQASMLFRHAKGMIEREAELSSRCRIFGGAGNAGFFGSVVRNDDASFLRVISADATTKHGGNTHLAMYDEIHAAPNAELYDVLNTSTASDNRAQPLFVMLTTADYERPSICNEQYEYACQVRDGKVHDPRFLPVIYEATDEDDWTNEATWKKANPNAGVSVSLEYLAAECEVAKRNPRYMNTYKRLHLNLKTRQDTVWLSMDDWGKCPPVPDITADQEAFGGLDLSTTQDLTAWVLVIPPAESEGVWTVLPRFFVPEATIERRIAEHDFLYATWRDEGHLIATPGNVVDYDFIRAAIRQDAEQIAIREIGYDPWNATQTAVKLQEEDGFTCTEVRQGFASLSAPSKYLESLVLSRRLAHGDHPVLTWCAGNAQVRSDPAGNIKPVKPEHRNRQKIDGIVATIIALARATVAPGGSASPQLILA